MEGIMIEKQKMMLQVPRKDHRRFSNRCSNPENKGKIRILNKTINKLDFT